MSTHLRIAASACVLSTGLLVSGPAMAVASAETDSGNSTGSSASSSKTADGESAGGAKPSTPSTSSGGGSTDSGRTALPKLTDTVASATGTATGASKVGQQPSSVSTSPRTTVGGSPTVRGSIGNGTTSTAETAPSGTTSGDTASTETTAGDETPTETTSGGTTPTGTTPGGTGSTETTSGGTGSTETTSGGTTPSGTTPGGTGSTGTSPSGPTGTTPTGTTPTGTTPTGTTPTGTTPTGTTPTGTTPTGTTPTGTTPTGTTPTGTIATGTPPVTVPPNVFLPFTDVLTGLTNSFNTTVQGAVSNVQVPVNDVISTVQYLLTTVGAAGTSLLQLPTDLSSLFAAGTYIPVTSLPVATIDVNSVRNGLPQIATAPVPLPTPAVPSPTSIAALETPVAPEKPAPPVALASTAIDTSHGFFSSLPSFLSPPSEGASVLSIVEHVIGAFVASVSITALLAVALPGIGGLLGVSVAGIRIGYRQAKASTALPSTAIARFVGSGPAGVVRSGSQIALHARRVRTGPRRAARSQPAETVSSTTATVRLLDRTG